MTISQDLAASLLGDKKGELAWYAAQVQAGKEARVATAVLKPGREILLPVCPSLALVSSKKWGPMMIRGTMIPGYLFFRAVMTDEVANEIMQVPEVIELLPNARMPWSVSDDAIEAMRNACDAVMGKSAEGEDRSWMVGQWFYIQQGPWSDRVGLCSGISKDTGTLLLPILGSLRDVPVPISCLNLVPVEPPKTQHVDRRRNKAYTAGVSKRSSAGRA